MIRAVFFDRDNTLTRDDGYCHKISDFAWMPGADKALVRLARHHIPVFIITNQGGIAKGLFTKTQMQAFHDHLCHQAQAKGGKITDIAFCPHHPQATDPSMRTCACRKPQAALFHQLANRHEIDLARSVMIGDRQSDIEAGQLAGCHSYLYHKGSDLDGLVKDVITSHFTDNC